MNALEGSFGINTSPDLLLNTLWTGLTQRTRQKQVHNPHLFLFLLRYRHWLYCLVYTRFFALFSRPMECLTMAGVMHGSRPIIPTLSTLCNASSICVMLFLPAPSGPTATSRTVSPWRRAWIWSLWESGAHDQQRRRAASHPFSCGWHAHGALRKEDTG